MMEEPPVQQEDPPNSLPLQCVLKEDECSNLHWQEVTDKISTSQNSRLLFLTVEYIEDVGNNEVEFSNYSPNISENERVSPLDPNLSSSGRYSPLYNTLVIPTDGQSSFQNSVVVVPTTRNNSQISIFVDQSQVSRQLIVGGQNDYQTQQDTLMDNIKLPAEATSQLIVDPQSGFVTHLDSEESSSSPLNQKVIITTSPNFVTSNNSSSDSVGQSSDVLSTSHSFFQGEEEKSVSPHDFVSSCTRPIRDEFASPHSPDSTLLNEDDAEEGKELLDPSEYVIDGTDLKQDELLLSASEQNTDLLMKPDSLMEVDSYNLTEETYIASEEGNSYSTMEEQLDINNIEKPDNEYLLPDTMPFEDTDSNMLQSNLEVFASQVLDNNSLLLYDKSRLRQNKKHPAEHLGFDYWCEDCDDAFGMKCGRHEVKVISDKPVLSRARATLPKEHLAINKLHGDTSEEGVFARKTIPKRVQFGPIEGALLKEGQEKELDDDSVALLLEVETGELLKLDVSDEQESNWMRFVRRAKNLKEQNLVLTQQGRSLYFTTTRVIPPRHELKVGYSPQYAEKRKLTVLEDLSWNCFECPSRFTSSEELQKHLNVHEGEKEYDDSASKKKPKNSLNKGIPNILRCKGNSRTRNHHEKLCTTKENECWNCHKVFPRTYSLKRHLLLVHAEKDKENSGSIVKTLEEKNEKLSMTNTLFKKKQSNGTGSEWLCTHCNLTFDNPSVLNLHTLTHAAEDLESEAVSGLPSELSSVYHEGEFLIENGDVQCPQCTQEFPSKRELIDHVSTHGKMTLKKCCPNPSKPYKCDQCYKSFASDIRLQRHMLVHGSEETKPYQCETCFKRFLNNSALSCHLKTHYDKKCFECPLCKEEFEQVFGLKEHVKVHSSDGSFTCPHCSKVCKGYADIRKHIRYFHAAKRFHCDSCPKIFARPDKLKLHRLSVVRKHIRAFHSGHQHVCKDCGKMCPTLDKLRMHSLRHSDHREFLCANCGKQFKRKDKLKEHMKRMHSAEKEMKLLSSSLRIPNTKDRRFTPKMSPMAYDRFIYKCRNCMVGFKRRGMLVNHLAKRHPDIVPDTVPELNLPILKTTRDYFCQYCDKIYKSSSKRKAHILKNHPGAELPMSNRQKGGIPFIPGVPNPTFSQTVGSVKTTPHGCQWCHKQYASKAKLLQHQRKKHMSMLPQAQQMPRPIRNASSPVGSEVIDSPPTPPRMIKIKIDMKQPDVKEEEATKLNCCQEDSQAVQGVFDLNTDVTQELDAAAVVDMAAYKKTLKGLPENISCDLLHQAMTELSQTLSEYKLPFPGAQENLLKMIGLKDGMEAVAREEGIPAAQMTRTWPDLPPYPPR